MNLRVLRRFEGCWGCWDGVWCTWRGFSDTKEVLKSPGRGLWVLRGFYVITPNHEPSSVWLVRAGTAGSQECLKKTVKGAEGTAGSSISEVYAGHQEKPPHPDEG